MNKMGLRDWLWVAITIGGIVYGYGALQTRVSALESNNVPDMKTDIAVIKRDVSEIKADVKALRHRP